MKGSHGRPARHAATRGTARARAIELLDSVSIPEPQRRIDEYPHQLSGGLRQRALIALALACEPKLLIADEPTTALDVTIQAQILELLRELQARMGLGLLLITHDLGVVAEMGNRVAVMYAGRIVEHAPVRPLFAEPKHPYTRGLLACLPRLDRPRFELVPIKGVPPSAAQIPSGCAFHPRCDFARENCSTEVPPLRLVAGTAHFSACHYAEELGNVDVAQFREESVELVADETVEESVV